MTGLRWALFKGRAPFKGKRFLPPQTCYDKLKSLSFLLGGRRPIPGLHTIGSSIGVREKCCVPQEAAGAARSENRASSSGGAEVIYGHEGLR